MSVTSVYKFLAADRAAFLENYLLRFTQAAALNDPYECLAAFPDKTDEQLSADMMETALATINFQSTDSSGVKADKLSKIRLALLRLQGMAKTAPGIYRKFIIDFNQARINKGLGILSLSRRWDSALMWSHYTKTYSGYCVGFRRDHSFFDEIDDGELRRTSLLPVKYTDKRPVIPQRQADAPGLDIFITKSKDWAYEEEDRLLVLLRDADKVIDSKPYPVHLFKMPSDAITEIILGHNAPEHLRVEVLAVGKRLGVPVYKTQLSERSFDVDRAPLQDGIFI
ncbi:DUF2971 domain-containing protein [Pseudomonas sp. microsymbiont 2]